MDTLCNLYVHRENKLWGREKKQLPVTLVTGFLGAGKTTLLNYVLSNKHNLKIAAAVNDFASINVDGQIIRGNKAHDSVIELTNGCLCCSISSEFKTAVWNLLQDADIGKIDYIVIETSGVTDPLSTISTLEQDYGHMYRIRLDAVITVVDTDALVDKLERGDGLVLESAAADSQLKCADVVLLNKQDLITESQLKKAKEFIMTYVPGAQVYACTKCAVPLHYIMEVSEVASGPMLVSHEVTSSAYMISNIGGSMNVERKKRMKDVKDVSTSSAGHISQDEFRSVVYETNKPFSFAAFQVFLGKKFPPQISRMKGTLWFEENRSCLYSFHMSGRQRYDLEPCASVGESLSGAFSVQLVAIGRGIDPDLIEELLKECLYDNQTGRRDGTAYKETMSEFSCRVSALVRQDKRFEIVDMAKDETSIEEEKPVENCIDFRVTGVIEYGVSIEEAATIHGIDFNRMNLELAKRVNGTSAPICVLPVMLPCCMQVCRYAFRQDAPFEELWVLVTEVSKKLIDEFYRAVGYCKCGM